MRRTGRSWQLAMLKSGVCAGRGRLAPTQGCPGCALTALEVQRPTRGRKTHTTTHASCVLGVLRKAKQTLLGEGVEALQRKIKKGKGINKAIIEERQLRVRACAGCCHAHAQCMAYTAGEACVCPWPTGLAAGSHGSCVGV